MKYEPIRARIKMRMEIAKMRMLNVSAMRKRIGNVVDIAWNYDKPDTNQPICCYKQTG